MINPDFTVEQIETRLFKHLFKIFGEFTVIEHLEQMAGGFEAYLYKFKIEGNHKIKGKLVLRLFPKYNNPETATWQTMIHNLLREECLPVPRVYYSTSDTNILGGSFLIMEYVEGKVIDPIIDPSIFVLTAKTQARLHLIDGAKISEKIVAHGHSVDSHTFEGRIRWIVEKSRKHPGLEEAVNWLIDNRPPEPLHPKIIHGDLHPMNLLVHDGEVTAILDWSGFMVGDPMSGLGWTKALFIATGKHEFSEEVFNHLVQMYTDTYESIGPIDYSKLEYFVVYTLVRALFMGKEGQEFWTQLPIVNNIIKEVATLTGIRVHESV
jgi:aminoglycoside phosphotransferase (APT) family kinase protein